MSGGVSKKVGGGLVIGIVRERFCVGDMGLHVIKTTSPFVGLPHYTTASLYFYIHTIQNTNFLGSNPTSLYL